MMQHKKGRAPFFSLPQTSHWFWREFYPHIPIYCGVGTASFIINLLSLAGPFFIMAVFDRVVPSDNIPLLWNLAAVLLAAYCLDFTLRCLRSHYVDAAGRKIDRSFSSRLVARILADRLDTSTSPPAALMHMAQQLDSIREVISSSTILTLLDVPFLLFFLAALAFIGGHIVWIVLVGMAFMFSFVCCFQRLFQKTTFQHRTKALRKQEILLEALQGRETVKSLQADHTVLTDWEKAVEDSGQENSTAKRYSSIISAGTLFLSGLITAGVLICGVHLLSIGKATPGALIACVVLAGRALGPIRQIALILSQLENVRASLISLGTFIKEPPEQPGTLMLPPGVPLIRLEQATFTYPGSAVPSLLSISLEIRPGDKIAVIGPAGAGKSTLARLLAGLYRPASGRISVNGIALENIAPQALKGRLGYMPQDLCLFSGTVKSNILFGHEKSDNAAFLRAAHIAGVDAFTQKHPLGYEMPVKERGSSLSGGQRQAIALARVLLRVPEVLILDEPTSSLDNAAESAMVERLFAFSGSSILIILTHRLSLLHLMTRVLVLDKGRLIADGSKEDLQRDMPTFFYAHPMQQPSFLPDTSPALLHRTQQIQKTVRDIRLVGNNNLPD